MPRVRDFNSAALKAYASPHIQVNCEPRMFLENRAWQFVIFLPRWFVKMDGQEEVCTVGDQDLLEGLLERDFGGYTSSLSAFRGAGRRGAEFETNLHAQITVLASRWRGTMRYFRALRKELEACSGEQQILILRQELVVV